MKPEYNFGTYSDVEITLLESNVGNNPLRVQYIIRQITEGKIELKSHQYRFVNYDYFKRGKFLFRYRLTDETEIQTLMEKMQWAGAKLDICHKTFYFVFPPDAFNKISDWRRKYWKDWFFDSSSYCYEMTSMNEFALSKWAEAHNILEAYRLCIFPSFKPAQVIRIWFHRNTAYVIHKQYEYNFCDNKPKLKNAANIEVNRWYKLKTYMRKFWRAKSWYWLPELSMLEDGATYFFEGWRDGEYKVLDDHSPDDGVSWYAIELFKSIAK